MGDLPKGWKHVYMLDILDYQGGSQPPKKDFIYEPKEGYVRLIQIRDFGDDPFPTYVPDTSRLKKVTKDDLLLARYGGSSASDSLGRICTGLEGAYNVALVKLIFSNELLDRKYVKYLFMGSWFTKVISLNSRSCQSGFNRDDVEEVIFPLAPLNEQRRIVAKLEKLLAKVNACGDRLDKIPTILKRFRQSVLAAACSGRLTADWREQHPTAPSWKKENLINLIEEKPRNGFSGKSVDLVDYETNTKVLTLTATTSGTFRHDCFKYLAQDISLDSHAWLHPTDILIQRGNTIEYVGVSAIYTGEPFQFIYPDLMMKIRVKKEIADHRFIYFALSDIRTRNYFRDNATGTAGNMPKINQQVVMNTPIHLPSLAEQEEIVRRVESLFQKCDQIEARYQKAKAYTDKLTQAILAKAFRGELVPQDPNDEPAEVLLERIKAEKAAAQPQKKPRKPRSKKGKAE
jgi:type I restriction enzyme S subunit